MECKEEIVDVRVPHPEELEKGKKLMQNVFKFNQTMPYTDEYFKIMKEVFRNNIGENSVVNAPIQGACIDRIKIGNDVFIFQKFCKVFSKNKKAYRKIKFFLYAFLS